MEKTLVLGIDPGLSGAVAVIDLEGEIVSLQNTPTLWIKQGKKNKRVYVETQMTTIIDAIKLSGKIRCAGIEHQHSRPGQGAPATFSQGFGYGVWIGILAALRVPIQKIDPTKWKREMGIAVGSDKAASVVRALQLFPATGIHKKSEDGKADALLIGEWLRRQLTQGKP